jgi:hypothetical protein
VALLESIKSLKAEVDGIEYIKLSHELAMKAVKADLDKQKAKFSKLKEAIEEK